MNNHKAYLRPENDLLLVKEASYELYNGLMSFSELGEVHGVAKRILTTIRKLKIDNETLQNLHKQIELTWHNILSFCPEFPAIVSFC